MPKMIQSVKFKQVKGYNFEWQGIQQLLPSKQFNKLKQDTDCIKNEPKLLIVADKTTNFYKLEPSTYNDLLGKKHHEILQESTT